MTEDSWLTSNLNERYLDHHKDFCVVLNPTRFKRVSFEEATLDVIKKISTINDKIFISLSGGLDSEYILRSFHRQIPVTPIIVSVFGTISNKQEIQYAYSVCKELQISPVIIEYTDREYIEMFISEILNKYYGVGINITPVVFAKIYAQKRGGILLTGEHCIDDEPLITKGSMCEWDLYFENENVYGPLIYTPEIFYAIVEQFNNMPVQQFKSQLFKLPYRNKMKNQIKDTTQTIINKITNSKTRHDTKRVYQFGNKQEILALMNSWIE